MPFLYSDKVTRIVIHCAATPNGRQNTIEDVDSWHKQRGFRRDAEAVAKFNPEIKHVGYHYVIEIDGAIREGRSLDERGAHVKGWNSRSIGICMLGTDKFTAAQWESLGFLVTSVKATKFPDAGVVGHRDLFAGKTCPGFDVSAWLKNDMRPSQIHVIAGGAQ